MRICLIPLFLFIAEFHIQHCCGMNITMPSPTFLIGDDFDTSETRYGKNCGDDFPNCPDWARDGDCKGDVLVNCKLSCNFCLGSAKVLFTGPSDFGGSCPSPTYKYSHSGHDYCCCGNGCCWDRCNHSPPADCLRGLPGGEWRLSHELGYYQAFGFTTTGGSEKCSGSNTNWGCCTSSNPCGEGLGDCDNDSQCQGVLVCEQNKCPPGFKDRDYDCCAKPAENNSDCQKNTHVTNLLESTTTNTVSGWTIDCNYGVWNLPWKNCQNWYGWRYGNGDKVGSITTTLSGSGRARLDFGNCHETGTVKAFLDGQEMGSADAFIPHKVVEFNFNPGSVLRMSEYDYSVIQFNNLEIIDCPTTLTCDVSPGSRTDCGYPGISKSDCEKKNCCFNNSIPAMLCFYPSPDNGQNLEFPGYRGDWGPKSFCDNGGHAIGFGTKVEGYQGNDGDDSAMNGLALKCSGGGFITSAVGERGSYDLNGWDSSCDSGYTGARVRVEGMQEGRDNTATNCVEMYCAGSWKKTNNCMGRGTWTEKKCKSGKICAMQTRVEKDQGNGDDTALNNINLYCC